MPPITQYKFSDRIRLYNLGDIHRGNAQCDVKFLHMAIKAIQNDKRAYWVSTGDLLEIATTSCVSDSYEAMSPQDELDTLCEELEPIKSKCLGLVASNHHNRINKESGLNLDKLISMQMGIKFLGISSIIDVTCKRCSYFIHMHHGVGGGTQGNKVNRALKVAENYSGCDIYFSGHTHTYSHTPFQQRVVDRKRVKIRSILSHSIVTGHCLDWSGSYAEKMALRPAPIGFAYVDLGALNSGREANKKIEPGFFSK